MKCKRRKKAFLGALLGAAGSLIGASISAAKQKEIANEQRRLQIEANNRESSNNLTNAFNSANNTDYYNDKLTFRTGGRFQANKVSYASRFKCGGKCR